MSASIEGTEAGLRDPSTAAAGDAIDSIAGRMENDRERLLMAALPHVAFEGWSPAALRAASADAGLTAEEGRLIFPGGAREIVTYWSEWSDGKMLEEVGLRPDFAALRVRERIAAAVRARIALNAPWREAVRRTMSLLALPQYANTGVACTWRTVDAIWYACGDIATDLAYYSKRLTLAGVYGSTVLYWLDDTSDESADTWSFLDRRIDNVMQLPVLSGRLRQSLGRVLRPWPLRRRPASGG